MTFTQRFQTFVCEGDSIACEIDGYEIVARIVRDDCRDAPDERQDGFWPSLYKDAPGFIGPGTNHRQRFAEAHAKAEAVMAAWRKDEWFYCGIVLSVALEGVMSTAAQNWATGRFKKGPLARRRRGVRNDAKGALTVASQSAPFVHSALELAFYFIGSGERFRFASERR